MTKKNKLTFILLFVVSTAILLLPLFFREQLSHMTSLGLAGLFFVNFFSSATLFLPTPGFISVAVASNIYNPILVALVGALGSSSGEAVGFIFGRTSVEVMNGRKHKILYHLNKFVFDKYGPILLFFFALVPNPIVDGLGILAGMAGYPLHKFIFSVFLGRLLRNLIIILYFGKFS